MNDSFDRHWNEIRDSQKAAVKTARWLLPLTVVASLAAAAGLLAFIAYLVKWVVG